MKIEERRLWHIGSAYHEAGHAVIAARHALLGGNVFLDPSEDYSGGEAGSTTLRKPADLDALRRKLKAYIRTAAAGREAQLKAIRLHLVPYESRRARVIAMLRASTADLHDFALVAEYLETLGEPSDKEAVRGRYEEGATEAATLMKHQGVWWGIRRVAEALLTKHQLSVTDVGRLAARRTPKKRRKDPSRRS